MRDARCSMLDARCDKGRPWRVKHRASSIEHRASRRRRKMAEYTVNDYHRLVERLQGRGVDVERVKARLKAQEIETPSWGYADSGTRFGVFAQAGAAVTIYEKLADAAQVHRHTGIAPLVATHVLWDLADDNAAVSH